MLIFTAVTQKQKITAHDQNHGKSIVCRVHGDREYVIILQRVTISLISGHSLRPLLCADLILIELKQIAFI